AEEERATTGTSRVYEATSELAAPTDPKRKAAYWGAYRAYTPALREAGVRVGGAALEPPRTATTVRQHDGKRRVQDGPFAETKEQLGGYVVIDVPSLDKALEWAARCPSASTGAAEVRPNMSPSPPPA